MVSLRFRFELPYTTISPKPNSNKHPSPMRTGVWGWCGPPRRRRRRSPSPPPNPPPISLCPSSSMQNSPTLQDFAESIGDEAGLSDVDFSELDDTDLQISKPTTPTPMVMDAVSKKWMGNETEFERFHQIVAHIGKDEFIAPDKSVFQISNETVEQWRENGQEHNAWFRRGTTGEGIDIRDLAKQFSLRVERRKGTS